MREDRRQLSYRECVGVDKVDSLYYANRFWVGGSQTWDGTAGTKWSTTSGGSSGAAVPTAADDVFFDASSTGTCTLSASSVARSINCTGIAGAISHPAATTISIGDGTAGASNVALKLVAGMTYTLGDTATSAINFVSTSATTQTIDFAGKSSGNVNLQGVGSSYKMTGTWNSAGTINVINGAFDVNGQTTSWGFFASNNSNIRSIALTSTAAITITGATNAWFLTTTTNLTFDAGLSTITMSNTAAQFQGGGLTYNNVSFTGGAGTKIMSGANTFANLPFTGTAAKGILLTLNANITVTGTLTPAGNSLITRILIASGTVGTPITITAAAVALTNVDFRDITGAGAATWSGTSVGDAGGNSGITFTTPVTRFWVGNTGNWDSTLHWSTSSGGSSGASVPLCHDTVVFDANSITSSAQTITQNMTRVPALNFSNVLNNPTLAIGTACDIYGGLTLKTGMGYSGSSTVNVFLRSDASITTNGVSITTPIATNAPGCTVTFADALTSSSTGSHVIGTLTASSSMQFSTFASNNSNTRTINMGSSNWTVTGTGTVWNTSTSTGCTINGNGSTIIVSDTSATGKTIAAAAANGSINNITITGGNSATILNSGNWSCNNFTITNGATTFQIPTTNTVTINGVLTSNGTLGNLINFQSGTPGTTANISLGGSSSVSFASFKDINANARSSIYATNNCTDNGNNHNVIFAQPKRLGLGGVG